MLYLETFIFDFHFYFIPIKNSVRDQFFKDWILVSFIMVLSLGINIVVMLSHKRKKNENMGNMQFYVFRFLQHF